MLEVNAATFSYSANREDPPAVREVSLRVEAGETVAIIGQNGSGKSTLAKLLAGIIKPGSGTVLVDELSTATGGEALWTIRQRVGMVFQNPDDQLVANTVIDDIAFGPENLGLPRFEIEERTQEAMTLLGLQPYAHLMINELSVGQKQRVAVAGVLAMRPRYLILDEPTTMISGQTARQLLDTMFRLVQEQNITILHITHFMHEITAFQRVIVMDKGQILRDGPPGEVFAHPDELRSVGLDVPMVTQLGQRLQARGWIARPEIILSTEQLTEQLQETEQQQALLPDLGDESRTNPQELPLPDPIYSPDSTSALLELKNVHYTYLRGTPFAVEALHGLSLSIRAGETTALVGPTQSGKSTVVDLLARLIKPTTGTYLFESSDVHSPTFDIERIRSNIGVVFQSPEAQIFEDIVGKDVSFGPRRKKVSLAESRRLVQESLEAVGLSYEDFRLRYTYALSGGEKRRVAIAGVLALQPKVIIFDEPTAGLDPRGRRELLDLIRTLKQRQDLTIIYTSSSLQDVIDLADTIHILDQGRHAFSGTPRQLLKQVSALTHLDIALPEAVQIALALQQIFPAMHTDVLSLIELEHQIERVAAPIYDISQSVPGSSVER